MDAALIPLSNPSSEEEQEAEWDTDGFVIPSLSVDSDLSNQDVPEPTDVKPPPKVTEEEEKIYLGPHGAPPSQSKQQQQQDIGSRKQRFKQKLKEADRKYSGTIGRENKVDNIRELVASRVSGNATTTATMSKSSPRDWLDPHCHESQFERYSS